MSNAYIHFLKNLAACHKNPAHRRFSASFALAAASRSDLMRASFATTAIIRAAPSRTAGISAALATLERYTHELGTALVALERLVERQIERLRERKREQQRQRSRGPGLGR